MAWFSKLLASIIISAILTIILTLDNNSWIVTTSFLLRRWLCVFQGRIGYRLMKKRFTFREGKEKGRSLQNTLLPSQNAHKLETRTSRKMTTVLGHTYSRTIVRFDWYLMSLQYQTVHFRLLAGEQAINRHS